MAGTAELPAAAAALAVGAVGCIYWRGNAGRAQTRAGGTKDGHPTPQGVCHVNRCVYSPLWGHLEPILVGMVGTGGLPLPAFILFLYINHLFKHIYILIIKTHTPCNTAPVTCKYHTCAITGMVCAGVYGVTKSHPQCDPCYTLAITKWCKLQSNVCNINNTRLALSTLRSE